MPKRLKKTPRDVNQLAHGVVAKIIEAGEEEPPAKPPKGLSEYMRAIGKRGGRIGGKRRMETMTPQEREQAALKAARARWDRAKTQTD